MMMNYRIVVVFSEEKEVYLAIAPEFENCTVEATSRVEAIAKLEEELAARIENMKEKGVEPPKPIDLQEFNGELHLKVSAQLHRDLVFAAKEEKVELDAYLTELLTRSVMRRGPVHRRRNEGQGRGRSREGQGQRYHDIMENRADFIEYVRRLDSPTGRGGRSSRGRGRKGRPRNKE